VPECHGAPDSSAALQLCSDEVYHSFDVLEHVFIAKAHDVVSPGLEMRRARCIVLFLVGVLRAIDLDDQFVLTAAEVGEVPIDRHLTPELCTFEMPIA
jgi:hypothetical protein